jgi:hypothetical protein
VEKEEIRERRERPCKPRRRESSNSRKKAKNTDRLIDS